MWVNYFVGRSEVVLGLLFTDWELIFMIFIPTTLMSVPRYLDRNQVLSVFSVIQLPNPEYYYSDNKLTN
jgi:hypothetical protein